MWTSGAGAPRGKGATEGDSGSSRPKVFILSAVRLYREGLAWSLVHHGDVDVVGTASPDDREIAVLDGMALSAVLLDMASPTGLTIASDLNRRMPHVKVIAFAVSEFDDELLAYAEAGVAGYVTRDGSIDDLVTSIVAALNGEINCSPRMVALLFQRLAKLAKGAPEPVVRLGLTQREQQIARLLAEGLSNKEIAGTLRIGSATVKNHVHNVLEKLQLRRRGEVAARLDAANAARPHHRALAAMAEQRVYGQP